MDYCETVEVLAEGGLRAVILLNDLAARHPGNVWVRVTLGVLTGERLLRHSPPKYYPDAGNADVCFLVTPKEMEEMRRQAGDYIKAPAPSGMYEVPWWGEAEMLGHLAEEVARSLGSRA